MSALNKLCLILILFEVFVVTAGSPWRVNLRARIFGKIVRLKLGLYVYVIGYSVSFWSRCVPNVQESQHNIELGLFFV